MDKKNKSFLRGMATAIAVAHTLETWNARELAQGTPLADFEAAGVDEHDLKTLREALK